MPDTEDRIWTFDDRGTSRGARVPNGALGAPRNTPPTTKSSPGMPVGLARRGVVSFDPPLDSVTYVHDVMKGHSSSAVILSHASMGACVTGDLHV